MPMTALDKVKLIDRERKNGIKWETKIREAAQKEMVLKWRNKRTAERIAAMTSTK